MIVKKMIKLVEKLGDKIRRKLSHYPILYAFIGGVGIVLFWRGVWHTADDINLASGASLIIGAGILIIIGVFVYEFIGNRLIISGLVGEKELAEKEESEIETEEMELRSLKNTLVKLEKKLDHMETHLEEDSEKDTKI